MRSSIQSAAEAGDIKEVKRVLAEEKCRQEDLDLALSGMQDLIGTESHDAVREDGEIKYKDNKVVAIATLLLDAKASLNTRVPDPIGSAMISILTFAVKKGHAGLVQLLINKGVDVNPRNLNLINTALSFYTVAGLSHAKALIAWRLFCADPSLLWKGENNNDSKLCVDEVIQGSIVDCRYSAILFLKALNTRWVSQIRPPAILRDLTPFFVSVLAQIIVSYSDEETDSDFIEKEIMGAPKRFKTEYLDKPCELPLIVAADKGDAKEVTKLLAAKADPTASINGNTALMWAIHGSGLNPKYTQVAKLLIESMRPAPGKSA